MIIKKDTVTLKRDNLEVLFQNVLEHIFILYLFCVNSSTPYPCFITHTVMHLHYSQKGH